MSLVKSDRSIIELLYRAKANYELGTPCSKYGFLNQPTKVKEIMLLAM